MANVNANAVRQTTYMATRNPGVYYALKALFLHLAANKGNPDLTYKNISALTNASDGTNSNDQVLTAVANIQLRRIEGGDRLGLVIGQPVVDELVAMLDGQTRRADDPRTGILGLI